MADDIEMLRKLMLLDKSQLNELLVTIKAERISDDVFDERKRELIQWLDAKNGVGMDALLRGADPHSLKCMGLLLRAFLATNGAECYAIAGVLATGLADTLIAQMLKEREQS